MILVVADDAVREVEAHEGLIDLMNRLGVTIRCIVGRGQPREALLIRLS